MGNKKNDKGNPTSGIPQYVVRIPASNQVKGKSDILEKTIYLKDTQNKQQNSSTLSRSQRKSSESDAKEDKNDDDSMEVDQTNYSMTDFQDLSASKNGMKRPAEETIDTPKLKRDNKIQDQGGINEYKQDILSGTASLVDENSSQTDNLLPSLSTAEAAAAASAAAQAPPPPSSSERKDHHTKLSTETKKEVNKFKEFDRYDCPPYRMFLQNVDNSQERINPLLVNKFLIEKFKNKDVFDECYPVAKNKVCIVAKSRRIANEVLKLKEWEADKKEIFIPNHLMTRQGIIKNVPLEFSEDNIRENLEANDPHFGPINVIGVRRFTRRNRDPKTGQMLPAIPTRTVQLTFRGQYLPPRVALYKITMNVEVYYPQIRQCYRCYNFGHLKSNCKSALELCQRCADPVHGVDSPCPRTKLQPMCKNCKQGHIATDKSCEVRQRQQEIRDYATEYNLTVAEAKKIISGRGEYNMNINEFPTLGNNWTHTQSSQMYEPSNTDTIGANKRSYRPTSHKNSYKQGTEDFSKDKERSKPKESQKYQEIRSQHRNMLISPSGHLPNMKYAQLKNGAGSLSQSKLNSDYVHDMEPIAADGSEKTMSQELDLNESIQQLLSKLLEKTSIEKLYKALDSIASASGRRSKRSRDPDSLSRKTSTTAENDDNRWKLEYHTPHLTDSTQVEVVS
ncbi:hypothetical protein QAD02_013597 [Eretmocerus hayati]|uniref:Uncharacterized protein n=1 Tax=Eretmocerus hayati TaxID=131215 RepID=A0ACC2P340_9HYME|nr:hypothetical protein QAD02_013597 [Eretmocerus hayati]